MFTGNRGCPKVITQHERHSEYYLYAGNEVVKGMSGLKLCKKTFPPISTIFHLVASLGRIFREAFCLNISYLFVFFVNKITARRISPTGGVWSAIQRLIFGYGFQIGFGIAVQYQLGIRHRIIVDQIVQL